jgi:hypothetical protein
MKFGFLSSIRWEPFPKIADLSAKAAKNPILRTFLETGVPRPPQSRNVRDEVIFLLRCAAEIEHALLVQYLFAGYSINPSDSITKKWPGIFIQIAREEMGHLLTVQNLLLAVGDNPYFDRQQLTTDPFPFQLEHLSKESLAKYVTTESPPPDKIANQDLREKVKAIEVIANQAVQHPCIDVAGPEGPSVTIKHVGVLYAWLYWLFLPSDTLQGPWKTLPVELAAVEPNRHLQAPDDFPGLHDPRQAEPIDGDWGMDGNGSLDGPIYVRPIESAAPDAPNGALQTIYLIAAQGEGPEDQANSHFRRFLKVYDQFVARPAGATPAAIQVACSPSVDPARPGRTITHLVARHWAQLFNTRYQMLVLKIWYAMSQPRSAANPSQPAARPQLISQSVNLEMLGALSPIARKLVTLPLKPRSADGTPPAEFAGATFELPDEVLPSQPGKQPPKLIELIDRSADQIKALRALIASMPANDPDRPTQADIDNILKPLADDDSTLKPALQTLLQNFP